MPKWRGGWGRLQYRVGNAGWPKFAMHAFVMAKPEMAKQQGSVVVASLVPASAALPAWLGGAGKPSVSTVSKYPFGDDATITVTAAKALTVMVRVPGWAVDATIDGKKAANGTMVSVPHPGGATIIKVALNPVVRIEYGWGPGPMPAGPSVSYAAKGAVVPSDPRNVSLFDTVGAALTSSKQAGYTDIRSGSSHSNSSVILTSEIIGDGHAITKLAMSFRYIAGYSPDPAHPPKVAPKAATISVVLADAKTGKELATVYTSPPLGDYSFDHYTGYSPPIRVESDAALSVPNGLPVHVVLKFANNDRNVQIQLAPLSGLNMTVGWAAAASTPAPPPPLPGQLLPGTNGLAVLRGPLVFTLHPEENMTVIKNYSTTDFPSRPKAVDWAIGTSDPWNYAIDAKSPVRQLKKHHRLKPPLLGQPPWPAQCLFMILVPLCLCQMAFDTAASAGWSADLPFSTDDYPFSISVAARRLPLTGKGSWGYWENSKITANLPDSPLDPTVTRLCPPELKVRTPAHTKQLGWYV